MLFKQLISNHRLNNLDTINGLSIVIYLIYHFTVTCWEVDRNAWTYGPAAVGIFFMVSGFRMHYSLSRRFKKSSGRLHSILFFWRDRAIRIYPMYIIAILIMPVLFKTPITTWQILGYDSPYWFINRILQCYLLAPFLYYFASSRLFTVNIFPFLAITLLNLAIFNKFIIISDVLKEQFIYYNILFSYFAYFFIGMLVTSGRLSLPKHFSQTGLFFVSSVYVLAMLICGLPYPNYLNALVSALHLLATFGLLISFNKAMLPPRHIGLFSFLGKHSLTIYLFEPLYYLVLFNLNLITLKSWTAIAVSVLFFPFFLICCHMLQTFQQKITSMSRISA